MICRTYLICAIRCRVRRVAAAALAAAAAIVPLAEQALAQLPGDSPRMGVGAAVAASPGLARKSHAGKNNWHEADSERQYREAVNRIPNRKPSNDPWKSIRHDPTVASIDRHRSQ